MLSKEEYKKNLTRMFDSLRTDYKGEESCMGVNCGDCPLFKDSCYGKWSRISNFRVYEAIEIVENWVKEHPVMTNVMKFKEIFGVQPSEISSCDDFWNSPYREQVSKNELECHEIHKRYGKGMAKEVKGFSSAYPSICDLKIVLNIDGTWLTIHDNLDTVVTIKLSDLNDIINCEVLNNKESEDKK